MKISAEEHVRKKGPGAGLKRRNPNKGRYMGPRVGDLVQEVGPPLIRPPYKIVAVDRKNKIATARDLKTGKTFNEVFNFFKLWTKSATVRTKREKSPPPYRVKRELSQEEYIHRLGGLIEKKGATIQFPGLKTGDFYNFAIVNHGGYTYKLSSSEVGDREAMESYIRQLDNVRAVIEDLSNIGRTDLFYSDISRHTVKKFGRSKGAHIAFASVVDGLRQNGIYVHS